MNLLERIKELCKKRSISVSRLEEELGFPSNTIYQWKNRTPGTEKLSMVADYFNVTIDYLLGRTDTPQFTAKEEREATVEEALNSVMSYDGQPLTDNDREILRGIIEAYLDKKK
ncbi:helix-turn-helix domain-containing protein [Enterococcus faecalis]|uniref:helix-turn-helix domain-containing protein n=1 Tax=Enterococcus faecalis TaxID=1351 RepID=UPI0003536ACC|nr:helix-turn-helix transcriptional regulator [Enterococcus faecalis]EPI39916.1 putative HTH-type transcriptional regulator AnsR [Enterococcus faecalis LA3B-2]